MIDLFVIVSHPRCGSNFLRSLLASHRDIVCHNEIFHPNDTSLFLPHLPDEHPLRSVAVRDRDPHQFLDDMIRETVKYYGEKAWVGGKLLLSRYQIEEGLVPLLDRAKRLIFLTRDNRMAWFSSHQIAMETGEWLAAVTPEKQHQIRFDATEYEDFVTRQIEAESRVMSAIDIRGKSWLKVDFDALKNADSISEILRYLNLPDQELQVDIARQNTSDVLARFSNPEDVKAYAASIGKSEWIGG